MMRLRDEIKSLMMMMRVEKDLHDLISWASLQKQFIIITGDLNLDRLKPDLREGKILHDIEEIHGLTCMITKATRVTKDSQTLLDVILTKKPELFRECNVYNPEISDHAMVYGVLTEKAIYYPNKVISVRNFKNLNVENLQNDFKMAVLSHQFV